ncbi:MAG: TetR/AcrR family transcriptional regulator [Solirubrobacteraceae bacterium]
MSRVAERRRATPAPGSGQRALYGKLHPGPGAPREQVVASQRARIGGAVIEIVAQRGYGALTVREIARLAGVSTHTFYEHFADKDECFHATYERIARRCAKRVLGAQRRERDWEQGLRASVRAFAEEVASGRKAAQFALVEAFAGGRGTRERMSSAVSLHERVLASALAQAPDGVRVPPLLVMGMISGIARVARMRVIDGRAHELPRVADELADWVLALRRPDAARAIALGIPVALPRHSQPPLSGRAAAGERDDRQRLIDAALALAAEGGYQALTGPCVRTKAGIPRRRFLELFPDVEACFSTGVAELTRRAMRLASGAGARAPDWPRGVHRTVCELCVIVHADPVYARLAFVEAFAPGPSAVASRDASTSRIARALRATAPDAQRPSELVAEASVGAIRGLVCRHVLARRSPELVRAAPLLSFLALAPAIGAEPALQAMRAEQGGNDRACGDAQTFVQDPCLEPLHSRGEVC